MQLWETKLTQLLNAWIENNSAYRDGIHGREYYHDTQWTSVTISVSFAVLIQMAY